MPHKDPEAGKAYRAAYYKKHKAKISAYHYAYYQANKDVLKAKSKAYHEEQKGIPGYSEKRQAAARSRAGLPAPTREKPFLCECCGRLPNGVGSLHLDHCHESGKFRGWLCHSCNTALGHLGDTLSGVINLAQYLRKFA